jgi:hypothetical protein
MGIGSLLLVAILTAGAQHVALAQQTLGDAQFQIRYSASGITSVTHLHDKYDTEYISAGDILIRFWAHGEKTWKQASAATLDKSSGTDQPTASFTIGVQIPTIATSSKASASVRFPGLFALNDQRVPREFICLCYSAARVAGSGARRRLLFQRRLPGAVIGIAGIENSEGRRNEQTT